MKNISPVLLSLFFCLISCAEADKTTYINSNDGIGWQYSENEDKMSSKKTYFAIIQNQHQIYLAGEQCFPMLKIFNGEQGNKVVYETGIENEAYSPVFYGDEEVSIRMRFDNEEPKKFKCNWPDGGSRNIVFINNPKKVIAKLKGAKKLLIEASFVGNETIRTNRSNKSGARINRPRHQKEIVEFDVAGLKWDH